MLKFQPVLSLHILVTPQASILSGCHAITAVGHHHNSWTVCLLQRGYRVGAHLLRYPQSNLAGVGAVVVVVEGDGTHCLSAALCPLARRNLPKLRQKSGSCLQVQWLSLAPRRYQGGGLSRVHGLACLALWALCTVLSSCRLWLPLGLRVLIRAHPFSAACPASGCQSPELKMPFPVISPKVPQALSCFYLLSVPVMLCHILPSSQH